MIEFKLDGQWQLHCMATGKSMSAAVPGSVYEALLANGEMDDPFWRDNENDAMELMKEDYEYEVRFSVPEELWRQPVKELVFEGIDTIADIYLNGTKLASVDNMHRTWRFQVTEMLKACHNQLRVFLHDPIPYIRDAYKKCRTDGSEEAMTGFPLIRKAHYMFGWDWGPHLPDAGIFRSVTLVGAASARIENVSIRQIHEKDRVTLDIQVNEVLYEETETGYKVFVKSPEGEINYYPNSPRQIVIEKPKLWWPNGYGEQNLYEITIIQSVQEKETDRYRTRIGLRTLNLHREKDEWGELFAHRVNGVDCFAMGADYIPEDNLLGRLSKEKTRELLQHCKDCNFNTIRVWGGGFFPADWFYEFCDEMGLMVWQDLMFACAVYELDDHFEENIISGTYQNLDFSRSQAFGRFRPLLTERRIIICFLIAWKSIREIRAQMQKSYNICSRHSYILRISVH